MKRICKQCGVEFTLTQDEIAFYQSKNLHIPKRCEKCRMENRAGGKTGQVIKAYDAGKSDKKKVWIAVAAVLLLLAVGIAGWRLTLLPGQNGAAAEVQPVQEIADIEDAADSALPEEEEIQKPQTADAVSDIAPGPDEATEQAPVSEVEQAPAAAYTFRSVEKMQEHFEKHGAEFGYATVEEYLAGANRVVASPEALHKLEAEDGDDVYYLESTNEIVFVSTSGYLRTYFKPDNGKAYFDRQ